MAPNERDSESLPLSNGHAEDGSQKENTEGPSEDRRYRLPLKQWVIENFSWSWFTASQSSGGIAAVLSECPKQFAGLQTIGVVVFIFNMTLFLLFTTIQIYRYAAKPSAFKASFTQPPESFFFGSFWLTLATMIINMQRFGVPHSGPWLIVAIRVCFWIYAAASLLTTTIHFAIIMGYSPLKALKFQPAMFLMIFNAMLTGTVASSIAMDQPPVQRLPIIVAGVAYQGLGWIVCVLLLSLYVGSLLESGWGPPEMRPALFITIGSAGFTIVALIGLARAVPTGYGYFALHPTGGEVLQIVALWVGIFMWLFAFWLFAIALVITIPGLAEWRDGKVRPRIHFTNVFWSYIFPNVGWTLGTIYIGQELESQGILWVSTAMVILLAFFWLLNIFLMAEHIFMSLFVDARVKVA